jgi:RND family efflux transporter MFP subunit
MTSQSSSRATARRWVLTVAPLLVLAVAAYFVLGRDGNPAAASGRPTPPPVYVVAVHVVRRPMPLWLQAVGVVQSEHSVRITPEVSGLLTHVYFHQGQYVQRGQPLFEIDPAPYRAAVDEARARYEVAAAQARRDAKLVPQGFIAPQAYSAALATAAQDKAALSQAKINLGYTLIRSPIDGLAGQIMIRAGNVVGPSDTTPLVTINQMSPILVSFQLPQQNLGTVLRYRREHTIRVVVLRESVRDPLGEGPLVFIDNAINTSSGTFLAMARLPNRPVRLWPGEYVAVRVVLTVQKGALVVRQSAVQPGQNGDYVYALVNGRAVVVPVTESRQIGSYAVLAKGPPAGTLIVAQVPPRMRAGARVDVQKILSDPPPRPWL